MMRSGEGFNQSKLIREGQAPQVEGLIKVYELGYRMQSEMPALMDLEKETPATQRPYGIDDPITEDFGRKCLLARRMVSLTVTIVGAGADPRQKARGFVPGVRDFRFEPLLPRPKGDKGAEGLKKQITRSH